MRVRLSSVLVDDQEKALRFYTRALGLRKEDRDPARRIQMADERRYSLHVVRRR
jgi:catechol 2,3-dioxygenase-like lactoylglutathione lyase family enzyme